MFYCQGERDRFIAERLAAALRGYTCILGGHVEGIGHFLRYPERNQQPASQTHRQTIARRPLWNILRALLRWIPREFRAYQLWISEARRLLGSASIDVLVLFQETVGDTSQAMAAVATARGIPYLVLPQTIPNPGERAAFYGTSPGRDGNRLLARIVTAIWPRWGYVHRGHSLLYMAVGGILAQYVARFTPQTPWIPNSGNARLICIECKSVDALYRDLGFPSWQRMVCGHPVDDTLYLVQQEREPRRQALYLALGLDPARRLVVVAFPPNQYTSPDISQFEWPDFDSMCRAWCDALEGLRSWANIVICPHPRLRKDELGAVLERAFPISPYLTEELVPLADLYIASISATIRWALACGVPTLNYDCYRYRYDDYNSAAGICTVEDWSSFRGLCESLTASPAAYEKMKERAEFDRHNWGEIDGHFVARFGAVLERARFRNEIVEESPSH